jgi:hypothetical protein
LNQGPSNPGQSQPYGQHRPFEARPAPRASRAGRIIWVVAAVLVALLAVGGYLAAGFVVAASDRQTAEALVEHARNDNNQISSLVKKLPSPPSSASSAQDLSQSKTAVAGIAATFDRERGVVNSDLPRLHRASATLQSQSGSLLVVPERGSLDKERSRVDAVVTAFLAARAVLQIGGDQMRALSSIFDAESVLLGTIQQQDVARALAAYPQVESKVQQAVTLSKALNVPPQIQALATSMGTLAADFKQFLQAQQSKNFNALQRSAAKVQADADGFAFDDKGFNAYETNLFKPYQDRYNQALRQAGFTVTG